MNVVAITRVKNEEDIIEPFVRHTCKHVDLLIIQDHNSTDNTRKLIQKLIDEKLNIILDPTPAKDRTQSEAMTLLMRHACEMQSADWIIPLDADEFIEPRLDVTIRDILADQEPELFHIHWNNFAAADPDDLKGKSVIEAMSFRNLVHGARKVIIPRCLASQKTAFIDEGNHYLYIEGNMMPSSAMVDCVLCHFPIRSRTQYAIKVAIGFLRYIANPHTPLFDPRLADKDDRNYFAWHYREGYAAIKAEAWDAFDKLMKEDGLCYASESKDIIEAERPLKYIGGKIVYNKNYRFEGNILKAVLEFAEDNARELHLSKLKREESPRKSFIRRMFDRS